VYLQQSIQNSVGNQLIEAHICGNEKATETETAEGLSFTVHPYLPK
jgi:hypothetical protein